MVSVMSGRLSTDETPVCVGNPADWADDVVMGSLCAREGTVSVLQLRPHPGSHEPALWWLTACPKHARQVRVWMAAGSREQVDTYGTAFLVTQQEMVLAEMADTPVLRMTAG